MNTAAEFLGAHAVWLLAVIVVSMLIATALLWHLVQKYSGLIWYLISTSWCKLSEVIRTHAPGLRLSSVLIRTRDVGRFLGIQALISIVVCVAAFAAFFSIVDEIDADEDLGQFDEALSRSLRTHVSPAMLAFFSRITALGDPLFLTGLTILVALLLLWRRERLLAMAWLTAIGLGAALNRMLKALFERARPEHDELIVTASGWSFPSGHASGSFLVYGMLGYLVVRHTALVWHIPAALAAVALIVFVGFSRVILQVHYFSDVLAGYAFAAAWVAMWIAGLEAARRRTAGNAAVPPSEL